MIKLNDKYYIGFDSLNIILYKKTTRGEKSKKAGTDRFIAEAFFGDFKTLTGALLQNHLVEQDCLNSLNDIIVAIEDFKKDILQSIIELDPDTKPYKLN